MNSLSRVHETYIRLKLNSQGHDFPSYLYCIDLMICVDLNMPRPPEVDALPSLCPKKTGCRIGSVYRQ